MNYFILKNREMPWGDYGNILFEGLLNVMDDDYNPIDVHLIERTGPYIPEIYIANTTNMIVREDIKNLLINHGITGIEKVHSTEIKKLVNIDWQKWDFDAAPQEYPAGGEPYNYVVKRKHNEKLFKNENNQYFSLALKRLHGIFKVVSENADYQKFSHLKIDTEKMQYDIGKVGSIVVSQKFKELIENNTDNCLRFLPIDNI